jgi:tyrosine-specific transport protein
MKSQRAVFWRGVQTFIGSVIGVGVFGLPFVFAQAGIGIALIHLVFLGIINLLFLLIYSDIVRNTKGHHRMTGIVEIYMGRAWALFSTVIQFLGVWGAIIAYIIIGGTFSHVLLSPLLGGEVFIYQIGFFLVSSLLVLGGIGFVSRIEAFLVFTLLIMLAVVVGGSASHIEWTNLMTVDTTQWFLPFGVVLFAFGGISAIPEVADVLGKDKRNLSRAIAAGIGIVALVYLVFSFVVVGVAGLGTSQDAVQGLGAVVGDWVLIVGSIVGLFSVLTSFLVLAASIMNTLIYDFKWPYLGSWLTAVLIPLIVFLFGARSFIDVVGFTGSVLVGVSGLLILYMYMKAKGHVCLPKRCLAIPSWVVFLCGLVFTFGIVVTFLGL